MWPTWLHHSGQERECRAAGASPPTAANNSFPESLPPTLSARSGGFLRFAHSYTPWFVHSVSRAFLCFFFHILNGNNHFSSCFSILCFPFQKTELLGHYNSRFVFIFPFLHAENSRVLIYFMQPDTRNDKYYVLVISDYQQASFRDVDGDPGRYKLGMRSNFLNWTASINVTGKAFFFSFQRGYLPSWKDA